MLKEVTGESVSFGWFRSEIVTEMGAEIGEYRGSFAAQTSLLI